MCDELWEIQFFQDFRQLLRLIFARKIESDEISFETESAASILRS